MQEKMAPEKKFIRFMVVFIILMFSGLSLLVYLTTAPGTIVSSERIACKITNLGKGQSDGAEIKYLRSSCPGVYTEITRSDMVADVDIVRKDVWPQITSIDQTLWCTKEGRDYYLAPRHYTVKDCSLKKEE